MGRLGREGAQGGRAFGFAVGSLAASCMLTCFLQMSPLSKLMRSPALESTGSAIVSVLVSASPRLLHLVPRHLEAGDGIPLHSLTVLPHTLKR